MKNATHAQSAPNLPAAKPGKTATGTAASAAAITADPRWAALCTRDPTAEGRFVYAVRSTGIYCRPGCPSRRPKPENVQFFANGEAAAAAGFRPCRRCRPEEAPLAQRQAAVVADLCRFIEAAETPPTLAQLAARAGLSPHHLHRLFQAHTGLTPGAYAKARRAERLRQNLAAGQGVTEAAYGAGYNASSRLYSEAGRVLGMTPGRFRQGGAAEEIRFAVAQTSLGALLAARSARGLCAILLGDDPLALVAELQARFPKARLIGSGPEEEGQTAGEADNGNFAAWVAQVVGLVEAPRLGLALPLDLQGTAFQRRVWQALQAIPPGETRSYTEIARDLGLPKAVRAVAAACAANPLAVAVPCHRVVRSDGSLAGYRWGLERKAALQQRERQQAENPAASATPPRPRLGTKAAP